jgi:hypothetical protein
MHRNGHFGTGPDAWAALGAPGTAHQGAAHQVRTICVKCTNAVARFVQIAQAKLLHSTPERLDHIRSAVAAADLDNLCGGGCC